MKFVSLFAGIGGFDLGLERAGFECAGQVEIDKHAMSVLSKHWPNVPKHNDVRTAKEWADEQGLAGQIDLVVGGFPCQDLSVAGRRAGFGGERSVLFYDAVQFANHVKAKWLILENVPGLFSSNGGSDWREVIEYLRQSGFNYIEWRMFNSQFFGVPQRRRRLYIIAGVGNPSRYPVLLEREGSNWDITPITGEGEASASGFGTGIVGALCARDYKGIGNQDAGTNKLVKVMPIQNTSINRQPGYGPGGTGVRDYDSPMFTLDTTSPHCVFVRMRGGKEGGGKGALLSENVSHTLINNNDQTLFVPKVFEPGSIARDAGPAGESDLVPTLRANMGDNQPAVRTQTHVRRLTPKECERLQAFPDDWTAGQSDSQRYKQLGNAVTVNVVHYVAQALKEALDDNSAKA